MVQLPGVIRQLGRRLFDERAEQQLIDFIEVGPDGTVYAINNATLYAIGR